MPLPQILTLFYIICFILSYFKTAAKIFSICKKNDSIYRLQKQRSSLMFLKCLTFIPYNNFGNFMRAAKKTIKKLIYTHTKLTKGQWIKDQTLQLLCRKNFSNTENFQYIKHCYRHFGANNLGRHINIYIRRQMLISI